MKLFFHLRNGDAQIPDYDGLEVNGIGDLRAQTMKALQEISKEDPELFEQGKGWRVNVADASGEVLFSLSLDAAAERLRFG